MHMPSDRVECDYIKYDIINHSSWFRVFHFSWHDPQQEISVFFSTLTRFSSFSNVPHWSSGAQGYKVRWPLETQYTHEHCSCAYHALYTSSPTQWTHVWQIYTEYHSFNSRTHAAYTFMYRKTAIWVKGDIAQISNTNVLSTDNSKKCLCKISILEWLLKDRITLKPLRSKY